MTRTQAYLYLLVAAAIIVASFGLFTQRVMQSQPAPQVSVKERGPIPRPTYTQATASQLAASNGFQEVVSYTDTGFQPLKFDIAQGDTVRFTNNSHDDLWVSAAGETLYPANAESCGVSALDSCHAVKSGEFWEFTFAVGGTWSYHNNLDKTKTGVINVQ